jgi:hypothetical protein
MSEQNVEQVEGSEAPEGETPEQKSERDAAIRKAYGTATAELRNAHREEFNDLMAAHAKEAGYEWKPRPSAEDKAREQYEKLIAEFPNLAK